MTYLTSLASPPREAANERAERRVVYFAIAAFFSASFPTVFGVRPQISTAGGTLFFSDFLLPVASLLCINVHLRSRSAIGAGGWIIAIGLYVLVIGLVIGATGGASVQLLLADSRGDLYLVYGLVVGAFLSGNGRMRLVPGQAFATFFAAVAVLCVVQVIFHPTGLFGGGGDGELSTFINGRQITYDSGVARNETSNTATVGAVVYLAAFCLRGFRSGIGRSWHLAGIACCVITGSAISRNGLVAVVVGLGVVLLLSLAARNLTAVGGVVIRAALLLGAILTVFSVLGSFGVGQNFSQAYQGKVIAGLSAAANSEDSSTVWRETESALALKAISVSPVTGVGIGVPYRTRVPGDPFATSSGTLYTHNNFLGVLIKGGLLAAIPLYSLFVWAVVTGLLRSVSVLQIRQFRSGAAVVASPALAAGLVSALVVAIVAPIFAETNTGPWLAVLLVLNILGLRLDGDDTK